MGVKISGRYLGNKRVEMTHAESGTKIITAAPKDNNGDGSSFSPTDLVAAGLGACMMTVMSIVAERNEINMDGAWFEVEKNMQASPRRIASAPVSLHLPEALTDEERRKLEAAARACPVHHSLHPETDVQIQFHYDV